MNQNIYLVRASHMQPFFSALKQLDQPFEPLLKQVNLTLAQFEKAENLIPEANLWHFVELAAKTLEREDFGFYVTQHSTLASYGLFGQHIAQADSLKQALHYFIHDLTVHTNYPNYWLEEQGDVIWLCRKATPGITYGQWYVEQHVVSLIIELVRLFAGNSWQPKQVKLLTDTVSGIESTNYLSKAQLFLRQSYSAVAIDVALLKLSNTQKIQPVELANKKVPENIVDTLKALMQQQGHSLREMISEHRFLCAQNLLAQGCSSIEIAKHLGYSDKTNFLRAFKRWSGMTVNQYKQEAS